MAREKKIILDEETINEVADVRIPVNKEEFAEEVFSNSNVTRVSSERENLVNCLRNEIVIVRFIARARNGITDHRHVLYGGMANSSRMWFTTPLLKSGQYVNVLTNDEKKFLEYKLGLEPNALNIYNRENNFWDDSNPQGIGRVELIKGDNPLDLSNPTDYIKYKILLHNKDYIAPSLQELQDRPKATYRFVIISESETAKASNIKVSRKAEAYMEFGKINEDRDKLKVIIETLDGRPIAQNTSLEYLQGKAGELLEGNTKTFLQVVKDPMLNNKVLIKKAIEAGIIVNRGNYLYMKDFNGEKNIPLCSNGQEPTLNTAAQYLSLARNQELKFSIEARLK